MKRFFKTLLILFLLLGVIEPVAAVFEESDLTQTLKVLKAELRNIYNRTSKATAAMTSSRESQQRQMVELMEDCNELSIILYSQKQNFTFDLTYALEEVSRRYRDFSRTFICIYKNTVYYYKRIIILFSFYHSQVKVNVI